MLDRKLQFWFYPEPTGDVGRDRNARTLQFTCLLYAFAFAWPHPLSAHPLLSPSNGQSIAI